MASLRDCRDCRAVEEWRGCCVARRLLLCGACDESGAVVGGAVAPTAALLARDARRAVRADVSAAISMPADPSPVETTSWMRSMNRSPVDILETPSHAARAGERLERRAPLALAKLERLPPAVEFFLEILQ